MKYDPAVHKALVAALGADRARAHFMEGGAEPSAESESEAGYGGYEGDGPDTSGFSEYAGPELSAAMGDASNEFSGYESPGGFGTHDGYSSVGVDGSNAFGETAGPELAGAMGTPDTGGYSGYSASDSFGAESLGGPGLSGSPDARSDYAGPIGRTDAFTAADTVGLPAFDRFEMRAPVTTDLDFFSSAMLPQSFAGQRQANIDSMTLAMIAEAADQGRNGMRAVGDVIANRAFDNFSRHGFQPKDQVEARLPNGVFEFSFWGDRALPRAQADIRNNTAIAQLARDIATGIYDGTLPDITFGAHSYRNEEKSPNSRYHGNLERSGFMDIGDHRFSGFTSTRGDQMVAGTSLGMGTTPTGRGDTMVASLDPGQAPGPTRGTPDLPAVQPAGPFGMVGATLPGVGTPGFVGGAWANNLNRSDYVGWGPAREALTSYGVTPESFGTSRATQPSGPSQSAALDAGARTAQGPAVPSSPSPSRTGPDRASATRTNETPPSSQPARPEPATRTPDGRQIGTGLPGPSVGPVSRSDLPASHTQTAAVDIDRIAEMIARTSDPETLDRILASIGYRQTFMEGGAEASAEGGGDTGADAGADTGGLAEAMGGIDTGGYSGVSVSEYGGNGFDGFGGYGSDRGYGDSRGYGEHASADMAGALGAADPGGYSGIGVDSPYSGVNYDNGTVAVNFGGFNRAGDYATMDDMMGILEAEPVVSVAPLVASLAIGLLSKGITGKTPQEWGMEGLRGLWNGITGREADAKNAGSAREGIGSGLRGSLSSLAAHGAAPEFGSVDTASEYLGRRGYEYGGDVSADMAYLASLGFILPGYTPPPAPAVSVSQPPAIDYSSGNYMVAPDGTYVPMNPAGQQQTQTYQQQQQQYYQDTGTVPWNGGMTRYGPSFADDPGFQNQYRNDPNMGIAPDGTVVPITSAGVDTTLTDNWPGNNYWFSNDKGGLDPNVEVWKTDQGYVGVGPGVTSPEDAGNVIDRPGGTFTPTTTGGPTTGPTTTRPPTTPTRPTTYTTTPGQTTTPAPGSIWIPGPFTPPTITYQQVDTSDRLRDWAERAAQGHFKVGEEPVHAPE